MRGNKQNDKYYLNLNGWNYNIKKFISPESLNSMSAIHCKIVESDTGVIRLSDCHGSIKWHNKLSDFEGKREFIEKIDTVINELTKFKDYVIEL